MSKLADLPLYDYSTAAYACPDCLKPQAASKRKDARCDECLHNKALLPVNYKRKPKKKDEEEDPYAPERERDNRWDD